MSTLFSTYYDKLIGQTSASFAKLVQTREHIEDSLKIEKSGTTRRCLNNRRMGLGDRQKRLPLTEKTRKGKKRSIQIQAMHAEASGHLAPVYHISEPPIVPPAYPNCTMYPHQRYTILEIKKVNRLKETGFLPHCLSCLGTLLETFG